MAELKAGEGRVIYLDGKPMHSFDLTEQAQEFRELNARRRPMLFGVSIVFVLLTIAGAWLLVTGPTRGGRTTLWTLGSVGLILVGGAFSIIVGILALRSKVDVDRLEVADEGVEIVGNRMAGFEIRWTDPRARFTIRDIRGWAAKWPNGTPRRVDFILSTSGVAPFPVTLEAMLALTNGAKMHGLTVSGWSERPPAPMTTRVIRIRHS